MLHELGPRARWADDPRAWRVRGVGGLLVQLAQDAGVRVIGTTSSSKLAALRALGAEALDYRSDDLVAHVQALAPGGVDAVFDHLGGASLHASWRLLAPGGTLVSYGLALLRDSKISMVGAFIPHLARIYLWNLLPNGRHAYFYNLWGGKMLRPQAFQRELRTALMQVFALLAQGRIQAQVARRLPSHAPPKHCVWRSLARFQGRSCWFLVWIEPTTRLPRAAQPPRRSALPPLAPRAPAAGSASPACPPPPAARWRLG